MKEKKWISTFWVTKTRRGDPSDPWDGKDPKTSNHPGFEKVEVELPYDPNEGYNPPKYELVEQKEFSPTPNKINFDISQKQSHDYFKDIVSIEIREGRIQTSDGWGYSYKNGELKAMGHIETPWFAKSNAELSKDLGFDVPVELRKRDFHWIYWLAYVCFENEDLADEAVKWAQGHLTVIMERENAEPKNLLKKMRPSKFADFCKKTKKREITPTDGKNVLELIWDNRKTVDEAIKELNLDNKTDDTVVEQAVEKVLNANPEQRQQAKDGQDKLKHWLVGQVMKELRGKADAAIVREMINERL